MDGELRLKRMIADLDVAARGEIVLATGEGRFDDLANLTPMAKEIAGLAARWSLATAPARMEPSENLAVPTAIRADATPRGLAKSKKNDYPQFVREKSDLVKLGWSPREKGTYEHRVPKAGLDSVVSVVALKGKSGHRFAMDEILKALASTKGAERVPSYQTYAVLSWLKWAGMVLQHGRQGYTVVRPQTFASSIEPAWQSLPQR